MQGSSWWLCESIITTEKRCNSLSGIWHNKYKYYSIPPQGNTVFLLWVWMKPRMYKYLKKWLLGRPYFCQICLNVSITPLSNRCPRVKIPLSSHILISLDVVLKKVLKSLKFEWKNPGGDPVDPHSGKSFLKLQLSSGVLFMGIWPEYITFFSVCPLSAQ